MNENIKKIVALNIDNITNNLREVFSENRNTIEQSLITIIDNNLEIYTNKEEVVKKLSRYYIFSSLRDNLTSVSYTLKNDLYLRFSIYNRFCEVFPDYKESHEKSTRNYIDDALEKILPRIFKDVTQSFMQNLANELEEKIVIYSKFTKDTDFYQIEGNIMDDVETYLQNFFGDVYKYAYSLTKAYVNEMFDLMKTNSIKDVKPTIVTQDENNTKESTSRKIQGLYAFKIPMGLFNYSLDDKVTPPVVTDLSDGEKYQLVLDKNELKSIDGRTQIKMFFGEHSWTVIDKNGRKFEKTENSIRLDDKYAIEEVNGLTEFTLNGEVTTSLEVLKNLLNFLDQYQKLYVDVCKNSKIKGLIYQRVGELLEENAIKQENNQELPEIKFDEVPEDGIGSR